MNFKLIMSITGYVLKWEAGLMMLPLVTGIYYGEWDSVKCFAIVIIGSLIVGFLLQLLKSTRRHLEAREGFTAVALIWIIMTLVGAVPFYLSGYFKSYIDCVFETMSGFTTTGSTILSDVEALSKSMLFWRSFTHWIGGMGVLVFVLGMMPQMDASNIQLLRAESPGPTPGKIMPRLKDTARMLYKMYFGLSMVCLVLLILTGMPVFDSFIHMMGTAGTGGFSCMNLSVGAYNNVGAEVVNTIFMLVFSVNFSMYYLLLKRDYKSVFHNEELRLFIVIVVAFMLLITFNIMPQFGNSFLEALRHASFQVSTIISTTGYSSTDFNLWPYFSKFILLACMVIGACAGSTGGGVKVQRILILGKTVKKEVSRMLHPRLVSEVKTEKKTVSSTIIRAILVFFFLYMLLAFVACLIVSLDGYDIETTVSSVLSALGNIGPALGGAGPMSNFGIFSNLSKIVLTFCMLAGRLEIFPVLILFSPTIWRKNV